MANLQNDSDKTSYCLGMDIGMSFKKLPVAINLEAAIAGITDMYNGEKPQIDEPEFMELMRKFQMELRAAAEKPPRQAPKTRNRKPNSSPRTKRTKTSSPRIPDSSTRFSSRAAATNRPERARLPFTTPARSPTAQCSTAPSSAANPRHSRSAA